MDVAAMVPGGADPNPAGGAALLLLHDHTYTSRQVGPPSQAGCSLPPCRWSLRGSTEAARVIRDLGCKTTCHIQIALGADERAWTPQGMNDELRPFTVGYVGSLIPEKGVKGLAEAVVGLDGARLLVIAGDGPERTEITNVFAAAGDRDSLSLLGLVPRRELPAVVRDLDVLVLPSRTMNGVREQFGLALAEAMLCGVAVVGSDFGAIPEMIDDAGLVFPEGDTDALRVQLARLRDAPAFRRDLADAGRHRALAMYSATALADETYALYQALAA